MCQANGAFLEVEEADESGGRREKRSQRAFEEATAKRGKGARLCKLVDGEELLPWSSAPRPQENHARLGRYRRGEEALRLPAPSQRVSMGFTGVVSSEIEE